MVKLKALHPTQLHQAYICQRMTQAGRSMTTRSCRKRYDGWCVLVFGMGVTRLARLVIPSVVDVVHLLSHCNYALVRSSCRPPWSASYSRASICLQWSTSVQWTLRVSLRREGRPTCWHAGTESSWPIPRPCSLRHLVRNAWRRTGRISGAGECLVPWHLRLLCCIISLIQGAPTLPSGSNFNWGTFKHTNLGTSRGEK